MTAGLGVDGETLLHALRAAAPNAIFIGALCAAFDDDFTVRKSASVFFAEPILLERFANELGAAMGTEVHCDYRASLPHEEPAAAASY